MKNIAVILLIWSVTLFAQELRIKADLFNADESKGITTFEGHVNVVKGDDLLNAKKVTIYTDKKNKPTKVIAQGDVSFKIETKEKARYAGEANRVIFIPKSKEYHFYGDVHLEQLDKDREIKGDEVILNISDGKAYAKGLKKEPVIMRFDIEEEKGI